MCSRFPGAQPVSFTMVDIQRLINEESVPAPHSPRFCILDEIKCVLSMMFHQLLGVREVGWYPCVVVHLNSRGCSERVFGAHPQSIQLPVVPDFHLWTLSLKLWD